MGTALIRLEDVGPGGYYDSTESHLKLMTVADYLFAQEIPFQVAVIPRFIDPGRGIDRDIGDPKDPVSTSFISTLHHLLRCGASLGMHGYTHQYGRSVSGDGYEFAYTGCKDNCPPDDRPDTLFDREAFLRSYAFSRFRLSFSAFRSAGLHPDWFETPHYAASETQRHILETCCPIIHEDNPDLPGSRKITFRKSHSAWGKTFYVPTPLGYVDGAAVDQDVKRMLTEASRYSDDDLASFFYHPFLEFPYIHLRRGRAPVYEDLSPLKQITGHLKALLRCFVSIRK